MVLAMTDCVIRSRIDPKIKKQAARLFGQMGLTMSDAIRLFLYQSVSERRIPFALHTTKKIKKINQVLSD